MIREKFFCLITVTVSFFGCKGSTQESDVESANWESTKRDRGACAAYFPSEKVTLQVKFKLTPQCNLGRVHGNAMTLQECLGFNYGEKNNLSLDVQWCEQGKKCLVVDANPGFLRTWKQFAQKGTEKLTVELFPDKKPYEMKVALGYKILTVTCPQWDDM